ncbi:MAG: DNA/RNA nuclease SfsA [Gammaproteobacteria bacterium]|nr:DNA/RNA nuclease SfsA [Gammaproteobacteria bacterium]
MKYAAPLERGRLVRRYKRFLADVTLDDGATVTMHCPNTGAMTNCAEPDSLVWYSTSNNPNRKYRYTWELVEIDGHRVSINSVRANAIVGEAIKEGTLEQLRGYAEVRAEVKVEDSRFDFALSGHPDDPRTCLVEVKSVTLLHDPETGAGSFPDAVSARAAKHIAHLTRLTGAHRTVLLFCVQHSGISSVRAAHEIDRAWAEALAVGVENGLEVMACSAPPTPTGSVVNGTLPVLT